MKDLPRLLAEDPLPADPITYSSRQEVLDGTRKWVELANRRLEDPSLTADDIAALERRKKMLEACLEAAQRHCGDNRKAIHCFTLILKQVVDGHFKTLTTFAHSFEESMRPPDSLLHLMAGGELVIDTSGGDRMHVARGTDIEQRRS